MRTDLKESVLVTGASTNPERYSYLATERLERHNRSNLILVGRRSGTVEGHQIQATYPDKPVHTVTVYLGPKNQGEMIDYLEKHPPKRVIFNPGTENPELANKLRNMGVDPVIACTLVMLGTDQF